VSGVQLGARVRVVAARLFADDRPYIGREGKAIRLEHSSSERGYDCFWVRFNDGEERAFERRELSPAREVAS